MAFALGNLKASFHCTHWHRFFPLKKVFFRIPPSPFPKGAPHPNQAFSIVFTTSSVPLVGDRNLRRKDVTALRCSEPLRSKVGGPSKVFARLCGMGPPGAEITIITHKKAQSEIIILSTFNSILMIAWRLLGSNLYSIFIINLCCTLLCKIILHHISKGNSHIVLIPYT